MELSDARTQVQNQIEDSSGTFWSSGELDYYLNYANRYYWNWLLLARHNVCLTTASFDIVSGTDTIALPADFYDIRLVEYVKDGIYTPIKIYERHTEVNTTSSGNVYNYYPNYTAHIVGSDLVLEPIPSEDLTDGIRVTYLKSYPTQMIEDDDESGSTLYDDLMIEKAIIQAKAKEETLGGQEDFHVLKLGELETIFKQKIGMIKAATRQTVEPFYFDGLF